MKPWQADFVTYSSPTNVLELRSMYHAITSNSVPSSSTLGNSRTWASIILVHYILYL